MEEQVMNTGNEADAFAEDYFKSSSDGEKEYH